MTDITAWNENEKKKKMWIAERHTDLEDRENGGWQQTAAEAGDKELKFNWISRAVDMDASQLCNPCENRRHWAQTKTTGK